MNLVKTLATQFLAENDEVVKKAIVAQAKEILKKIEFKSLGQAKREVGVSYLGSINSSAKIVKNEKKNYDTYIVYMAPHTLSGYNTCAKASKGCIDACLNTSGRVKMDVENKIITSRVIKTWLFYANREVFNKMLFTEIERAEKKSTTAGKNFSVRLNGTTDLSLSLFNVEGVNVLDKFPGVQFYDYTKVFRRLNDFENKSNYHLTFSFSGENFDEVVEALGKGFNVAIPFLVKSEADFPKTFLGYSVGNADETDLRFLDDYRISALKVKVTKDRGAIERAVKEGFVIDPTTSKIEMELV